MNQCKILNFEFCPASGGIPPEAGNYEINWIFSNNNINIAKLGQ